MFSVPMIVFLIVSQIVSLILSRIVSLIISQIVLPFDHDSDYATDGVMLLLEK